MMNEHPDRLDLILDAAIRDYSNAEPPAGFERRMLRQIQATRPRRSGRKFGWQLALAAIGLIVWIALPVRRVSPPALALLPPPVPRPVQFPAPAPAPRRTRSRQSPRREDPEPFPVTPEERVLQRFVQEQPAQALAVLSQPAGIKELTIEPLEIKELQ